MAPKKQSPQKAAISEATRAVPCASGTNRPSRPQRTQRESGPPQLVMKVQAQRGAPERTEFIRPTQNEYSEQCDRNGFGFGGF